MKHLLLTVECLLIYGWLTIRLVGCTTKGVFTDCSAVLSEPKGIIQTPNFPNPYPSPISCNWVIKAPPNKKVILYFTQFYVRLSFHVAEFDFYESDANYSGVNELGSISFIDILTSLVAYKPYVVVSFMTPADISNIHLRVDEYLLDVYGFNITYEIVDREESVNKHTCSVHDCSFLGNCLASSDYSQYSCHCFQGYFGDECQYGPYCDPKKNINMCKNGGKCRYLYGSMVNTCECPAEFEGPQCQVPKAVIPRECVSLGCSQNCVPGRRGRYECSCNDGYKLSSNNVTCVEKGRLRVVVGVLIRLNNNTSSIKPENVFLSEKFKTSLTDKVSSACDRWGSGVCDTSTLGISSFRNTSGGRILEFYFYCEKADIASVENAIRTLVSSGSIPPFTINEQYLEMRTDQALHLLDVQNYDRRPALKGKLLTLVCTARGSDLINFRWFKDGALVKTKLTKRNAWEQRVPTTEHDTQLDILNLENVTSLDQGVFTCEVTDYNEAENRSISVGIVEPPSVEVNTLSATVNYGRPVSLNCLSPGDTSGSFKYVWHRNGKVLKPSENGEIVEDLLPTGVRLSLRHARLQANYSCIVTNKAGNSSLTIAVYVIRGNESEYVCAEERTSHTHWEYTAPGGIDKHICSNGSKGFMKRYCRCRKKNNVKKCAWSKVNYAGCTSLQFQRVANQIQSLVLGYQISTSPMLFGLLYKFVNKSHSIVYKGDLRGIMDNLFLLLDHHYSFYTTTQETPIPLQRIIQLMGRVISISQTSTPDEINDLRLLPLIIRTLKLISDQDSTTLRVKQDDVFSSDTITFSSLDGQTPSPSPQTEDSQTPGDTSHNKGTVGPTIHYNESVYVVQMPNGLLEIPIVVDGWKTFRVISDLYMMLPANSQRKSGLDTSRSDSLRIPLLIRQNEPVDPQSNNTTVTCLQWVLSETPTYSGRWVGNNCKVLARVLWETQCYCPHSSLVAVAVGEKIPEVEELDSTADSHLLLQLACIMALCGLVATLICHLIFYRTLSEDTYAININIVISLISANVVLLLCASGPDIEAFCIAGRLLLYFFNLAAFSFLLVDALHVCLVLNRSILRFGYAFRYFIFGWGIPSILIIIMVGVYVTDYRSDSNHCTHICWIGFTPETSLNQFLAMVIPASILVLVYMIVASFSIKAIISCKDEARLRDKRKNIFRVVHSFVILCVLFILCIIKSYIEVTGSRPHLYAFICLNALLGVGIFVCRCVCDVQIRRRIQCSTNSKEKAVPTSSNLPLIQLQSNASEGCRRGTSVSGSGSRSGQMSIGGASSEASDYSRRKEHLVSLLGTSIRYNNDHLGDAPRLNPYNGAQNQLETYLDSGIFEGSDPEKNSTASSSLKEKETMSLCGRSLGRRSPRTVQSAGNYAPDPYDQRSPHRLSKSSNISSHSNEAITSNSFTELTHTEQIPEGTFASNSVRNNTGESGECSAAIAGPTEPLVKNNCSGHPDSILTESSSLLSKIPKSS